MTSVLFCLFILGGALSILKRCIQRLELTATLDLLRDYSSYGCEVQLASRLQWRRHRQLSGNQHSRCLTSQGQVTMMRSLAPLARIGPFSRTICSAGLWIREAKPHQKRGDDTKMKEQAALRA